MVRASLVAGSLRLSSNRNYHLDTAKVNCPSVLQMSAQQAPNGASDARDPSGFLSEIIGAPVTVKLNSGVVYKGAAIQHF